MSNSALAGLLETLRDGARTQREKGTRFEGFVKAYLENDPVQRDEFQRVQSYADWAAEHGQNTSDTGIDLVADLRSGDGFAAIQCKFYDENHRIRKGDIDSFMSASGKAHFKRRVIVDTAGSWSENAREMLRGQMVPTQRIDLADLDASTIDWGIFHARGDIVTAEKKTLRPHQEKALEAVESGFKSADRGKLIMACGTGKTFTSLKIAESLVGRGGRVLYLVPSLALMSQTIREWAQDAEVPLRNFAVCSDTQVGKRPRSTGDVIDIEIHDLIIPATTNAHRLGEGAGRRSSDDMTVVFGTYHSIEVISDAQNGEGLPAFDLIICDEAHRTTGVKFTDEPESHFTRVHDNDIIRGAKRLYMTATPRIYGGKARKQAREADAVLASMDDPALYGEVFYHFTFSRAVEAGLLSDYKVVVLAVDEGMISRAIQRRLSDENNTLVLDDATKIVGCYKALSGEFGNGHDTASSPQVPKSMKSALAFCRTIKISKTFADEFPKVIEEYLAYAARHGDGTAAGPTCAAGHVDGTFGARDRAARLDWLADAGDGACRVLSNVRCLSEGVDVPALDAVMFLHPRKSLIDVVQAVGRVMRKAKGKDLGYVILPVAIPPGVGADDVLRNDSRFKVVWQVLNALRAHDERLDARLNQGRLGQDISDKVAVVGVSDQSAIDQKAAAGRALSSVTHVVQNLPKIDLAREKVITAA